MCQWGDYHTNPRELLESFLHSFLFCKVLRPFGISILESYRALAAIAGVGFVLLVNRFSRAWKHRAIFMSVMLSGAYMQLFFGDVEHYSFVSVAILLYLYSAWEVLDRDRPLALAAAAWALACCFHLLAVFLFPSFLCLVGIVAWTGRWREVLQALVVPAVLIGGLYLAVTFGSASDHVGALMTFVDSLYRMTIFWYRDYDFARHFSNMTQLLILLAPSIWLVPVLLLTNRPRWSRYLSFMAVATAGMLLLHYTWHPQIGFRSDWNLFSPGAITATVFVAALIGNATIPTKGLAPIVLVIALSVLHSFGWINWNHNKDRIPSDLRHLFDGVPAQTLEDEQQ